MKVLTIFCYLCSLCGLFIGCCMFMLHFEDENDMSYALILPIVAASIAQFFYTRKMERIIYLPDFKQTNSLDDYAMNDMAFSDVVVQAGFWYKAFAMFNSIFLCFVLMKVFQSIRLLFEIIASDSNTMIKSYYISMIFLAVCAIPVLIFNLRTFNLKRIHRISPELNMDELDL